MTEKEIETVDKMSKFGGSFVQALSEAFYHADDDNFQKLKDAFPEYWEKYYNM